MKKQDIRNAYTQKLTELLNQGYTIFPDTMSGHQGEIAHIDLTDGKDIFRLLLNRDHRWERGEGGYMGDTITLTFGKAGANTWVGENWDGTVWNNRLEPLFQIEWADVNNRRNHWYTTLEEGRRCQRLQYHRYRTRNAGMREEVSDALKSAALNWIRKQPRMKTCRLEDIETMIRIWDDEGKRHYEIVAKGKRYTIR